MLFLAIQRNTRARIGSNRTRRIGGRQFATPPKQLLSSARVNPRTIACITFSGQMMGCVVLDRRARPLRSALIWADTRAQAEAETLISRVGMETAYRITGHRASASYSAAKIMWVRDHQPEIFAQAL